MATASRVTVGVTSTLLITAPSSGSVGHSDGASYLVICASDFYVGGPTVTVANGTVVKANVYIGMDLSPGEKVYAVAAAPVEVSVLEVGA